MEAVRRSRPGRAGPVACVCPGCSLLIRQPQTGRVRCLHCGLRYDLFVTAAAVKSFSTTTSSIAVPEVASEDKPACVAHPQNASSVACTRCGDYICDVCKIHVEGQDFCPKCFELRVERAELRSLQRKFRLPAYALSCGIASLVGGACISFFAAIVGFLAIGVGIKALMSIRQRPALQGKGKAIAGIILGIISVIFYTGLFIIMIMDITRKH